MSHPWGLNPYRWGQEQFSWLHHSASFSLATVQSTVTTFFMGLAMTAWEWWYFWPSVFWEQEDSNCLYVPQVHLTHLQILCIAPWLPNAAQNSHIMQNSPHHTVQTCEPFNGKRAMKFHTQVTWETIKVCRVGKWQASCPAAMVTRGISLFNLFQHHTTSLTQLLPWHNQHHRDFFLFFLIKRLLLLKKAIN